MWAIALPVLFAEVGETAIQFTDTALLGRVGTAELAAIGPVDAVIDLAIVPAVGLAEAMQIIVARRRGEGRERAAGPAFVRAAGLVLLVSVAVAAALRLGAEPVAERVISSGAVAAAVADFFRFGSFAVVPFALNLVLGSLWVGLGRTRVLVWATAALVVVNLVASAALIFGLAGLPALGIEGAGIGFLCAELAAFVVLAARTASLRAGGARRPSRRRGGHGGGPPRPDEEPHRGEEAPAGTIARLGAPIALQALVEALRWVAFFLVIERLGEPALAASSIAFACYAILLIPAQAFAETAYTMVSAALGREVGGEARRVMRAVTRATYVVTLPLVLAALVAPDAVLSLFTGGRGAIAEAAPVLRVLAVGMLVVLAAELALAAVFGTGDTGAGFVIEVMVSASLVGSCALAVVGLGVESLPLVWALVPLASGLGLAASLVWLRSGRWRRVAV